MHKKLLFGIGLIVLVVSLLGMAACTSVTGTATPTPAPQPTVTSPPPPSPAPAPVPSPAPAPPPAPLPSAGKLTIPEVVTMVRPSVVSINVEITTYDFFNRPAKAEGAGSGWVIREDGYIVTNNHVVQDADNVTVTLGDGRIFQAQSVKTDPLTDLAVVKIDASGLSALSIGDTSRLQVGDGVVAIGNALGQGISATAGIVSVVDVSLNASPGQTLLGLIQTDAAINPGNSGGPLVNMEGQVIGINSIKIAQVGVEGMGYAISINEAQPIINALIDKGYITRPWMGIGVTTVNDSVASLYNLSVNAGVLVGNIVTGGPADKAGLKEGDVITKIDGKDIADTTQLVQAINAAAVGQTLQVTYQRGADEATASVTLAESPPPEF